MAEPEPQDVLAGARERGIHCLPVPTPFAVGRVNCYLIEGDELVLVDAGPRSEKSLTELGQMIADAGRSIEEIGTIFVTHEHIDHVGLVRTVAERSGAEVAALDLAVKRLADFGANAGAENDMAVELMVRHGVDREVAVQLRAIASTFQDLGDRVEVTRPLAEGETLRAGDMDMEVHHRPGHSPTDTILFDPESGVTFGGDHLLSHISSNPLIARPLDGSPGRTRSLIDYANSLRKTREMDVGLMLSGHGDPITDHRSLIDRYLKAQERRREKVFRLIEEQPRTAHDVAAGIWGDVAVTQAYLTLSEVIGHADVLIEEGRITETERDGLVIMEAIT